MNFKKIYNLNMVIPAVVLYAVFFIVPTMISFIFAFTDWNPSFENISFTGLDNFVYIFSNRDIRKILFNTILFAVFSVFGRNIAGLLLALSLKKDTLTNRTLRTVFYVPVILSGVVVGLIFSSILQPEGLFNKGLDIVGLGVLKHNWLVDRNIVMLGPIILEIWKTAGFTMLIYLAGLNSIPVEYYESSTIDGANKLMQFRHITIPLLMPSILVNTILSIIGGLQVFEQVYVLTQGGPGGASQVLNTIVLSYFSEGRWGLGTAANLVLVVMVLAISLLVLKAMNRKQLEL